MSITAPTANTNPDAMPNYRHGVSHVVVAIRTTKGNATTPCAYGTPYNEVGIESITPQSADASSQTFYSDNGKPANVNGVKGRTSYNATFAQLSPYFLVNVLGHKQNATTGGIIESDADTEDAAVIAVGWQNEGTEKASRTWVYGVKASDAVASAMQSHGQNVSESPDSITLTVNGDWFTDGLQHNSETVYEGDPGYETFLDAVPTYATAAAPATTGDGTNSGGSGSGSSGGSDTGNGGVS